jgi:hypothetical protein
MRCGLNPDRKPLNALAKNGRKVALTLRGSDSDRLPCSRRQPARCSSRACPRLPSALALDDCLRAAARAVSVNPLATLRSSRSGTACAARALGSAQIGALRSGATADSGPVLEATRLVLFVRSPGAPPLRSRVDARARFCGDAARAQRSLPPTCERPAPVRRVRHPGRQSDASAALRVACGSAKAAVVGRTTEPRWSRCGPSTARRTR